MTESTLFQGGQVRDVLAELNYLQPTGERPRTYTFPPPNGEPQTNIRNDVRHVAIRDMRVLAPAPTLDREGFALLHFPTSVRDLWNEEEIRTRYYPEVEQAIADATGATRVFIFDHTLRRRVPGVTTDRAADTPRQPVARVHVDHSARSGPQRVRDLLADEAPTLLQGRVQIINLWRPLVGPLLDSPLALADAESVAPEDLVPSDLVYPHRLGETYSVRFNAAHRWYYVPEMETNEALLIKCYDNATDGRARFAPHTSFQNPRAGDGAPPRESIEVRTLVFHPA